MRNFKGQILIIIAVVCGAVAATHWPALSAKALSFDDQQYLIDNPLVQNPSWASAKQFLCEVLEPSTVRGYYQPLAMISLMLDYAAGGRENNLRPFHITSLALHTANTALIIVLLYLLFDNIWMAAAAGLLFGVHPMTVEPIPWIGERKTLLAAFFAFWSLIFYVRYTRTAGLKFYAGCFLMYLLALMSKPTSIPLPAVMLLMDYWPLKKLNTNSVFEKVPLFVLSAAFAVITYVSQARTSTVVTPEKFRPEYFPLVLCHNIIFYLYKIVLPINLSSHYTFPRPFGLSNVMVLVGVIGTCVVILLLLISLRWTRAALTGWLIFLVAIFPTMGVIGFTDVIASNRFAYLPSVGLLMLLASLLIQLYRRSNKARIIISAIVLLLAGSEAFATQRHLAYWRDTVALNKYMLTLTPDAAELYNNLGFAYSRLGRYEEEIEAYRQAIKLQQPVAEVYYNLGCAYGEMGRWNEAVEAYKQAIKIKPSNFTTYNNLGAIYGRLGQWNEAAQMFRQVLTLRPKDAFAQYNLGIVYEKQNRWAEAAGAFQRMMQINPDDVQAHFHLAVACLNMGEKNLALKQYEILKKLDPQLAQKLADYIH